MVLRGKDKGWVQRQHEGFQENQALSLRFCLGLKIMVFVLEEIGLLDSKAST